MDEINSLGYDPDLMTEVGKFSLSCESVGNINLINENKLYTIECMEAYIRKISRKEEIESLTDKIKDIKNKLQIIDPVKRAEEKIILEEREKALNRKLIRVKTKSEKALKKASKIIAIYENKTRSMEDSVETGLGVLQEVGQKGMSDIARANTEYSKALATQVRLSNAGTNESNEPVKEKQEDSDSAMTDKEQDENINNTTKSQEEIKPNTIKPSDLKEEKQSKKWNLIPKMFRKENSKRLTKS